MKTKEFIKLISSKWSFEVEPLFDDKSKSIKIYSEKNQLPSICDWLFNEQELHFAGLIVEEDNLWKLCYLFIGNSEAKYIKILTTSPLEDDNFPSISMLVHSADWHEREAEDLFDLNFQGHPRLGDFVLHDDVWQEGIKPMSSSFSKKEMLDNRKPKLHWKPRRIVDLKGAFIMTVGPIFSGVQESVNLQLETVGEEIIRAYPRLFFKYRGVEKIAFGKSVEDVLLLSERNAGTTAFSHALAYCMAIEQLSDTEIPERAKLLRIFFAELERLRSHIGTIEAICSSTGLVVAANQVAILEEEMLRLSSELSRHRYLFGLCIPGGLRVNCTDSSCEKAIKKIEKIIHNLNEIEQLLIDTSSFLDRLEEVGTITKNEARNYGLSGPMARGSNYCNDIRKVQPYMGYDELKFETPSEKEGDGYARLRVLFCESKISAEIIRQVVSKLPKNSKIFTKVSIKTGVGLAGVETPRGATWHWVRVDGNGKIKRYRLLTPSFANWHGFHLAIENFAFQDLPIILATLGLSVAENDR